MSALPRSVLGDPETRRRELLVAAAVTVAGGILVTSPVWPSYSTLVYGAPVALAALAAALTYRGGGLPAALVVAAGPTFAYFYLLMRAGQTASHPPLEAARLALPWTLGVGVPITLVGFAVGALARRA